MQHREIKRLAFILAASFLITIAVPLAIVSAAWDRPGLFILAVILGLPCIGTLAALTISSFALTRDYGLWGDKLLIRCPDSLRGGQTVFTSGRIGASYWARGCQQISWSEDGIAIILISQDVVFIAKENIRRIVITSRAWCEIMHSDPQLQSPIVIPASLVSRMAQSLPESNLEHE